MNPLFQAIIENNSEKVLETLSAVENINITDEKVSLLHINQM
jgi:hypothetical protein